MGQILIYVRRVSFCCLVYNPYEPTAHAPDKDGQASATDFAKVLRRQRRRADLLSFRGLCELRILFTGLVRCATLYKFDDMTIGEKQDFMEPYCGSEGGFAQ